MTQESEFWVLGLGGSDHEFAAALTCGADIRVAVEQERLSRCKHGIGLWYQDPVARAVDYCLQSEGIDADQVSLTVGSDALPARVRSGLRGRRHKIFPHHLCHAASAYMMLPPGTRAGVLVYDGYGAVVGPSADDPLRILRETFSFYVFGPDGPRHLGTTTGLAFAEQDDFPTCVTNSAGMLFEMVTGALGYDPMDSGKTMGLASYGLPCHLELLERFVRYGDSPDDCFQCSTDDPALLVEIERILSASGNSFASRADLAASVQAVLEKALINAARLLLDQDIECLCVSGGCALNTVANSRLAEELSMPLYVPPHCGDSGLAFGAIWLALADISKDPLTVTFRGNSLSPVIGRPGRLYSLEEHRIAVQAFYPRLAHDTAISTPVELAQVLARGAVIGVFNGRSEIGPRALGGRSIFADPRQISIRERINRDLKRREPYRPLAPIMLRSRYAKYFEDERHADSFMLKVARATDHCRKVAPAVVHVDGTCRIQVVDDNSGDPFLAALLIEFERLTGVGILINTSFNRRGEPVVEMPLDAVDAFLGLGLDGLWLDGDFYWPVDRTSISS
jgi:carbamoyltransferase